MNAQHGEYLAKVNYYRLQNSTQRIYIHQDCAILSSMAGRSRLLCVSCSMAKHNWRYGSLLHHLDEVVVVLTEVCYFCNLVMS